jgi:hypothetical protein
MQIRTIDDAIAAATRHGELGDGQDTIVADLQAMLRLVWKHLRESAHGTALKELQDYVDETCGFDDDLVYELEVGFPAGTTEAQVDEFEGRIGHKRVKPLHCEGDFEATYHIPPDAFEEVRQKVDADELPSVYTWFFEEVG